MSDPSETEHPATAPEAEPVVEPAVEQPVEPVGEPGELGESPFNPPSSEPPLAPDPHGPLTDAPPELQLAFDSPLINNGETETPVDPQILADRVAHLQSIVESLLFAADKALTLQQLGDLLGERDLGLVRQAVARIEADHVARGFQLHQVAGGYQFRTNPQHAVWVQKLLAQKPVRLTRSQLETLAICAYRQPITRPEIDEIRGVDSGGTLKTLMDRSLVRILGKKEEPGRPMLYGTTREFLEFFNLSDLKGLPSLREFHELSDEHRAQVEALEAAAPEGTVEAAPEARAPLPRIELQNAPEDSAELEEIDRLIERAGVSAAAGLTSEPSEHGPGALTSSDEDEPRREPTEEL